MDRIEVQQTGGFPLETDTLNFMQDSYTLLNALGYIAGNTTIISGCGELGNQVANGVIFLNGELLPFVGGVKQERIVVLEELENRSFEDGTNKVVYKKRYATFGNGHGSVAWESFSSITPLKSLMGLIARVVKLEKYCKPFTHGGASVLWLRPANEIPEGWEEDVAARERMAMGWNPENADFATIGDVGGSATVSLEARHNGRHYHTGVAAPAGAHLHSYSKPTPSGRRGKDNGSFDFHNIETKQTALSDNHQHSLQIDASGEGEPFSVLNPYRIVIYIKPIPE